MTQGESKRQRTFLELRLPTVSLVSNLLAPVTSNVQMFRGLKGKQREGVSSREVGNDCIVFHFKRYIQHSLGTNPNKCLLR